MRASETLSGHRVAVRNAARQAQKRNCCRLGPAPPSLKIKILVGQGPPYIIVCSRPCPLEAKSGGNVGTRVQRGSGVIRPADRMHGFHQHGDVIRIDASVYPVTQVEHVPVAATVAGQDALDLGADALR